MIIRLKGEFDAHTQDALRSALSWVEGPVKIDITEAHLSAAALGEIVILAHRIGSRKVTILNPSPIMRRILSLTGISSIIGVAARDDREPGRRLELVA